MNPESSSSSPSVPPPHRRRVRYSGKNPRRFEDKYKELDAAKYPETVAKVRASGKTPAGTHLPIMVREILEVLQPQSGEKFVDCTLGYGGHTAELLPRLLPGGALLGLDVDPLEQPKTEARLRALGYDEQTLRIRRCNFAGLPQMLLAEGWSGVDGLLADLGVSSMQIDTPSRGFSVKVDGPLDMRMNPNKGVSAAQLLRKIKVADLSHLLTENSDEPHSELLAEQLAGRDFSSTLECAQAIRGILKRLPEESQELAVRRVFQALRIEVNGEFAALDSLLRSLPNCLNPRGRAAILTFHSGEDRRVKKSFQSGFRSGLYASIAEEVLRPSTEECRANPRSSSAKLRWAVRNF